MHARGWESFPKFLRREEEGDGRGFRLSKLSLLQSPVHCEFWILPNIPANNVRTKYAHTHPHTPLLKTVIFRETLTPLRVFPLRIIFLKTDHFPNCLLSIEELCPVRSAFCHYANHHSFSSPFKLCPVGSSGEHGGPLQYLLHWGKLWDYPSPECLAQGTRSLEFQSGEDRGWWSHRDSGMKTGLHLCLLSLFFTPFKMVAIAENRELRKANWNLSLWSGKIHRKVSLEKANCLVSYKANKQPHTQTKKQPGCVCSCQGCLWALTLLREKWVKSLDQEANRVVEGFFQRGQERKAWEGRKKANWELVSQLPQNEDLNEWINAFRYKDWEYWNSRYLDSQVDAQTAEQENEAVPLGGSRASCGNQPRSQKQWPVRNSPNSSC